MSRQSDVLLITRVRTNNKGNQALSAAWVAMLQRAFPLAPVRVLERRPRHLLQFTLGRLSSERDPFRLFDRWTSALARLAPGPQFATAPKPPTIVLDETLTAIPRFAALRQRLNLRQWAARGGLYADEYRHRLAAAQRAKLVVINPAGEFFPHDPMPALFHLIDAHVIHKLGRPTAMVNHTMDIADPTLRKLIPRIYRDLDLIGFRDEKSVGAFEAMGGDGSNVLVTPDLALTTMPPPAAQRRTGTIAVAIHTPEAAVIERATPWLEVISGLQRAGFNVVLVSNELPSDQRFFDQVKQRISIPIEGAKLDFDRYSEMLGGYDFVVSSRMHTNILAMVAGTPVIPVEGPSFKITGLFQELGLATQVIQPLEAGWTERVISAAVAMRDRREVAAADTVAKVSAARERITRALVPRLQRAAVRA